VALIMRAAIIVASLASAALTQSSGTLGETLTCSTSFQGYRVCQGSDGYRSTEWDRGGMRIGQDNQGDRWTTLRWRDIETTTVEQPRAR
jgi:hypothetical protein